MFEVEPKTQCVGAELVRSAEGWESESERGQGRSIAHSRDNGQSARPQYFQSIRQRQPDSLQATVGRLTWFGASHRRRGERQ
eukprot:4049882-Prymnesium_polylepis.1